MTLSQHGISAVLVVYNEERVIERCLKSLAGAVDEIVVIHDGECGDRTLEIARQYTQNVHVEAHTGESEMHKIRALDFVSCAWILKIDADEFLSEELRACLPDLARDETTGVFAFQWPIWNGERYLSRDMPYKPVLFRKDLIYAIDFPHKGYSSNGPLKRVPVLLEHRPRYNNFSLAVFRRKWVRWIKDQVDATLEHQEMRFYHYSPEQKAAFHALMEKQIRLAHPLLAPAWFVLAFTRFFTRWQMWKNPRLIKVAVLQGMYAALLCNGLWKAKQQKQGQK